jgi:hypothetical protein
MRKTGSLRSRCRRGAAIVAVVTLLAVVSLTGAGSQELPEVAAETVAAVQPTGSEPISRTIEPVATQLRVVGMPAYPGAREVTLFTLNDPALRERVAALTTRLGSGIVISRLEAGIYRLPGVVAQEQVIAFYQRGLGEERKDRDGTVTALEPSSEADGPLPGMATKQGARPSEGDAPIRSLPGGLGYLSISVDPDPLQPRDTRVVVVRVEGSPEARTLLKPLTEIVVAAHLSGIGALPAPERGGQAPSPAGAAPPISALPRLPAFPNSVPESSTRLNAAQVQAVIRSLAVSHQTPAVRNGIAGLLREARSVTLNVYRIPRPVSGSAIVEFYRAAMRTYGGREVASDTADPSRPLLVYKLPAEAGVVMIRAYPEQTPLAAYSRVPLPSPITTAISVLRIEGALIPMTSP